MLKKEVDEFFSDIYHQITHQSENDLSPFATLSRDAVRKYPEPEDPRAPFALDRDRVLYSGAFRRYSGKTQVTEHIAECKVGGRIVEYFKCQ